MHFVRRLCLTKVMFKLTESKEISKYYIVDTIWRFYQFKGLSFYNSTNFLIIHFQFRTIHRVLKRLYEELNESKTPLYITAVIIKSSYFFLNFCSFLNLSLTAFHAKNPKILNERNTGYFLC